MTAVAKRKWALFRPRFLLASGVLFALLNSLLHDPNAALDDYTAQITTSSLDEAHSATALSTTSMNGQKDSIGAGSGQRELSQPNGKHYAASVHTNISQRMSLSFKPNNPDEPFVSACLLVMDDNFRLPEWIAYHYFTMPLRRLILTIDPRSRTSPSEILDRWRPYMDVHEWSDKDFGYNYSMEAVINGTDKDRYHIHASRQKSFYRECAMHLKKHKDTSWVSYHDVDEYVTLDPTRVSDVAERIKQPGSILQMIREWFNSTVYELCLTPNRMLYIPLESPAEAVRDQVPSFLAAERFETMRWRFPVGPGRRGNGAPKSIVDISRVHRFPEKEFGIHLAIGQCPWRKDNESVPLRVNHYLGSYEAFSHRDPRSRQVWLGKGLLIPRRDNRSDDSLRPWLGAFVKHVGDSEAKRLLKGAGEFL